MLNNQTNIKLVKNFYYKDSKKLKTRIDTWNKFGTSKISLNEWIINQTPELMTKNSKVIDLGCGEGGFIEAINKKNSSLKIYGIDLSSKMIEVNKLKFKNSKNISFSVANIENLPYENNFFNLVFANFVFHHIQNFDKALIESVRILKPNHKLAITTYKPNLYQGLNALHYKLLKSLNFPSYMLETKSYLHFTPEKCIKALRPHLKKINKLVYDNTLIFHNSNDALRYYQTAMMYRNSQGASDKNITKEQWEKLKAQFKLEVNHIIEREGAFESKGIVIGISGLKNEI